MIKDFTCKVNGIKPGDVVLSRHGKYKVVVARCSDPGWSMNIGHLLDTEKVWITRGFDTPEEAIYFFNGLPADLQDAQRGRDIYHGYPKNYKKVLTI